MITSLDLLSSYGCFGGEQRFYQHASTEIGLPMKFAVYLPPQAQQGPMPALLYLAGLTCTEETFMIKAGAQRMAAELGLALIAPDTSPRGANVPGEADSWDFGVGAGFYLDATQQPWARHWRMESYLLNELLPQLTAQLPIDGNRLGIIGFCRGGRSVWEYAAHSTQLKAGVAFYGSLIDPPNPLWPKSPMQLVADMKAPVLGLYGAEDQGIPPAQVEQMKAALAAAKKPAEFHIFPGAPHGFHADYRPSYRKEQAEQAWGEMQAWFRKYKVLT